MVVTPKCLLLPPKITLVVFEVPKCGRTSTSWWSFRQGTSSDAPIFHDEGTSDGKSPGGPVAYTETCTERFYHQHVQVPKMVVLTYVSSMSGLSKGIPTLTAAL